MLPNDPLKRWWVDAESTDPKFDQDLRASLIAFVAFDQDGLPRDLGTGFVVGSGKEWALAITAKHVLVDFAARVQRPLRHAPSALFVPASATEPSLHPSKLKAIWFGHGEANMLDVVHVEFNESLDIALCVVRLQEEHSRPFLPVSIPLDAGVPAVGTQVCLASCLISPAEVMEPGSAPDGIGQKVQLSNSVRGRFGVVTGVHFSGYRQYRWPSFTTSMPTAPGMSGGFFFLPVDGTLQACGVLCADCSEDGADKSYLTCGDSVAAMAWSALALSVPVTKAGRTDRRTLHDLMITGDIPTGRNLENINLTHLETGGVTFHYATRPT